MNTHTVHTGDSLEVLKSLPAGSIEAVVTDPPYGLGDMSPAKVAECLQAWARGEQWTPKGKGFMGKAWDAWVPPPELWREVLRVLKPGGHAVVFAGSRTQDLMSVSLRLAGFEVRDTLQWLYGSGFPKSLDVSKALDKQRHDRDQVLEVTAWIRATRDARGLRNADLDAAFGFVGMAGHWTSAASQPAVPTLDQVPTLLKVLGVAPEDLPPRIAYLLEHLNTLKGQPAETWHQREVIGHSTNAHSGKQAGVEGAYGFKQEFNITAPATQPAQQWQGWGTALKPAYEPAILARKPLDGTVAQNTLAHGCGALNIDACRVDTRDRPQVQGAYREHGAVTFTQRDGGKVYDKGRFPANVILDEDAAALLDAQTGEPTSRFFYTAKASRAEREAGLEARDARKVKDGRASSIDNPYQRGDTLRLNTHPTVKPIALMRYLVKLVTPPHGTVLDPFTGSGSTGCAAALERVNFVGIELDPEYAEIARTRIAHWAQQGDEPQEPEPPAPEPPAPEPQEPAPQEPAPQEDKERGGNGSPQLSLF
jgi:DNA modification methylase